MDLSIYQNARMGSGTGYSLFSIAKSKNFKEKDMYDLLRELSQTSEKYLEYNSKKIIIPDKEVKQIEKLLERADIEMEKYQKHIDSLRTVLEYNQKYTEEESNNQYIGKYMKLTDNRYIHILSLGYGGNANCEVVNTHYIGNYVVQLFVPLSDSKWANQAPRLIDEAVEISKEEYLRRKKEVLKLFEE